MFGGHLMSGYPRSLTPPLAVVATTSCNIGLAIRYCSVDIAGTSQLGSSRVPLARHPSPYGSQTPASGDPVSASFGHSGGASHAVAAVTRHNMNAGPKYH